MAKTKMPRRTKVQLIIASTILLMLFLFAWARQDAEQARRDVGPPPTKAEIERRLELMKPQIQQMYREEEARQRQK